MILSGAQGTSLLGFEQSSTLFWSAAPILVFKRGRWWYKVITKITKPHKKLYFVWINFRPLCKQQCSHLSSLKFQWNDFAEWTLHLRQALSSASLCFQNDIKLLLLFCLLCCALLTKNRRISQAMLSQKFIQCEKRRLSFCVKWLSHSSLLPGCVFFVLLRMHVILWPLNKWNLNHITHHYFSINTDCSQNQFSFNISSWRLPYIISLTQWLLLL